MCEKKNPKEIVPSGLMGCRWIYAECAVVLNNFLKQLAATRSASAIKAIAMISCRPSVKNTKPPIMNSFLKMVMTAMMSVVNVTMSMVHIGM